MSSAENFCKQFGQDQVQQTVGSDLDQNYLKPQSKKLEKQFNQQTTKNMETFQEGKE